MIQPRSSGLSGLAHLQSLQVPLGVEPVLPLLVEGYAGEPDG
jgi:hypothetical protein